MSKNADGSYTIRVPRGPEVYDPATQQLYSEVTLTAEQYKEWKKDHDAPSNAKPTLSEGWLNGATLPAALRDLVHFGDSELDVSAGLPDSQRPKVLRDLDEAAAPNVATGKAAAIPTDEEAAERAEANRQKAVTHAATSPAAQKSPPGTGGVASPSGAGTVTG